MNIKEISEGRVKNMAIDAEYDRQNSPGPEPTPTKPITKKMNYNVVVNGKLWKAFATEAEAMRAATGAYNNNPRLRVSVTPK